MEVPLWPDFDASEEMREYIDYRNGSDWQLIPTDPLRTMYRTGSASSQAMHRDATTKQMLSKPTRMPTELAGSKLAQPSW